MEDKEIREMRGNSVDKSLNSEMGIYVAGHSSFYPFQLLITIFYHSFHFSIVTYVSTKDTDTIKKMIR